MKHLIKGNQIIRSEPAIPDMFEKDGNTILGYNLLSDVEHYMDGWREEIIPDFDPVMQQLKFLYYSGFHDAVLRTVVDRIDLPTLDQAKAQKVQQIKRTANRLLAETDWYVIRKSEKSKSIPYDIATERDTIHTRSNELETAVMSLHTLHEVLIFEITY